MPREKCLYIGGVTTETSEEQLVEYFGKYGKIIDHYIPLDYHTRERRGFAYVKFEDEKDANLAKEELNGVTFNNGVLRIEWARGEGKTSDQMRRKETGAVGEGGIHQKDEAGHEVENVDENEIVEEIVADEDADDEIVKVLVLPVIEVVVIPEEDEKINLQVDLVHMKEHVKNVEKKNTVAHQEIVDVDVENVHHLMKNVDR
eukprot:UN28171